MNRFKITFIAIALVLIGSVSVCATYLYIYGVNCSFHIINDFQDWGLYEPIDMDNWQKIRETSDKNSIDIMIKINGVIVYDGQVNRDTTEVINFSEQLNFGKNHIQIFSRELNAFSEISSNVYFSQNFDIWVKSNAQYYKDGELLDLEKIREQLSSGELEDYNLNEAEVVFYSGFFINNASNSSFKSF